MIYNKVINEDIKIDDKKRITIKDKKDVKDNGKLKLYGFGSNIDIITIGKHLNVTEESLVEKILKNHMKYKFWGRHNS